ncbi:hypothetical protein T484DRAFT_1891427 [Baffinella frigidus]|nr:hypothetical protein T484DRAFT_1891427 [Cryptophyta sp. CCMP2293]
MMNPLLAEMFREWEATAVDFCAAEEVAAGGGQDGNWAAEEAEKLCDALLAPLHAHFLRISKPQAEVQQQREHLKEVSRAQRDARAALLKVEQDLQTVSANSDAAREGYQVDEETRRATEAAHSLAQARTFTPPAHWGGGEIEAEEGGRFWALGPALALAGEGEGLVELVERCNASLRRALARA